MLEILLIKKKRLDEKHRHIFVSVIISVFDIFFVSVEKISLVYMIHVLCQLQGCTKYILEGKGTSLKQK